jgi:hypothetical protein
MLHAEGELIRAVDAGLIPRLRQIGTWSRMQCSDAGFLCAAKMLDRGIGTVGGSGYFPGTR